MTSNTTSKIAGWSMALAAAVSLTACGTAGASPGPDDAPALGPTPENLCSEPGASFYMWC
jgi:hypothetical protein